MKDWSARNKDKVSKNSAGTYQRNKEKYKSHSQETKNKILAESIALGRMCIECKERPILIISKSLCNSCYQKQQYASKNREEELEKRKQNYRDNKERYAELGRLRYEANSEHHNKQTKEWRKANQDKRREHEGRRRARKRETSVEPISPAVVYERDGGICQICLNSVLYKEFSLDHVIPLSRGGDHLYSNIQASHLKCNLKKHARILEDMGNYLTRRPE